MAVDSVTPTIFILHPDGHLIKYIECSEYMTEPSDIAIFGNEYYICDFKGKFRAIQKLRWQEFGIFWLPTYRLSDIIDGILWILIRIFA